MGREVIWSMVKGGMLFSGSVSSRSASVIGDKGKIRGGRRGRVEGREMEREGDLEYE